MFHQCHWLTLTQSTWTWMLWMFLRYSRNCSDSADPKPESPLMFGLWVEPSGSVLLTQEDPVMMAGEQ